MPRPKPISVSYSKIKNFENCPRRHYECDIIKKYQDDGEQLRYGQEVHKALQNYVDGKDELPLGMRQYTKLAEPMRRMNGEPNVKVLTEQQLAIGHNYEPTDWFSKQTFVRVVFDVVIVGQNKAVFFDWKTGKRIEDTAQLDLMAFVLFCHMPELTEARGSFVWLKEGTVGDKETYKFEDRMMLWDRIFPRITQYVNAALENKWIERPGFMCKKYCPVKDCAHYGT